MKKQTPEADYTQLIGITVRRFTELIKSDPDNPLVPVVDALITLCLHQGDMTGALLLDHQDAIRTLHETLKVTNDRIDLLVEPPTLPGDDWKSN
jgi:hypothetical protein